MEVGSIVSSTTVPLVREWLVTFYGKDTETRCEGHMQEVRKAEGVFIGSAGELQLYTGKQVTKVYAKDIWYTVELQS